MFGLLLDRKIIEITGPDNKNLIQGLITNDVNSAKDKLIYSAMLNNKGRFLYDFFIFESKDSLFIDCHHEKCEQIIKKLSFYKLRSQVEITENDQLKVFYSDIKDSQYSLNFIDPRSKNLGFRIYDTINNIADITDHYHKIRINQKIPDGFYDLTPEKSLILEFNFDNLAAISYEKGCYVGQELTARTHHLGQIRKKLYLVKINNNISLEKNTIITSDDKNCGLILSSYKEDDNSYYLALIKDGFENSFDNLKANEHKINIIN